MGGTGVSDARAGEAEWLEFLDDGTVRLVLGGVSTELRRPTLGEYRESVERLSRWTDDPTLGPFAGLELWVSETLDRLSSRRLGVPDELPAWLFSAEVPRRFIEHWQTKPASPWRRLAPGESAPSTKRRTVLEEIAALYRVLMSPGVEIHPLEADQMELWQIAALLEEGEEAGAAPGQPRDLVAERIAAAREGRPEPEASATPPELLSMFGAPGV
jgi:hypothetical protein